MLRRRSIDGLGGTVWRSQAVVTRNVHGLATPSLDRATHQTMCDGALESIRGQASSVPDGLDQQSRRAGNRSHSAAFARAVMIAGLCLTVTAAGCAAPKRAFQPAQDPSTLGDLRYIHYLANVPAVTVDEGMRAVLMLTGPTQRWPTFEKRRAELQRLGAVKDAWRLAPDQVLTMGTLAYMLRTVCKMPRSLGELLASPTGLGARRYALRTCIDASVLPYARATDPVSGGELVGAISQAEHSLSARAMGEP